MSCPNETINGWCLRDDRECTLCGYGQWRPLSLPLRDRILRNPERKCAIELADTENIRIEEAMQYEW